MPPYLSIFESCIMSKPIFYRQCRLKRDNTETVSWIPEKYAKVGSILKLKNNNGDWVDDWAVLSAGSLMEAKLVENQAHNSGDIWKATSGTCPRGNK